MAPEMPEVDWAEAFYHLPVMDIFKYVGGSEGIWDEMMQRKPNDPAVVPGRAVPR